jgi:pilus assembly protein CpaD
MARFRNSAILVIAGIAVTGCGMNSKTSPVHANRSLYSENQPVVQRADYVIDLATGGSGVPHSELGRLTEWFDTMGLRYGDRIAVEDQYAGAGAREDIARVAAEYGILLSDAAPVTAGEVQPGLVRVVVSRMTASVPSCPNWRQASLPGGAVSTSSEFGCATNSNLAAMIADPSDLVLGREGAPHGDPATTVKAIKQYRDAKPTGADGITKVSTTTGGN